MRMEEDQTLRPVRYMMYSITSNKALGQACQLTLSNVAYKKRMDSTQWNSTPDVV